MSSVDQIFLVHMYSCLFCVYPSFYLSINLSFRGLELSLAACSLCLFQQKIFVISQSQLQQ
ncbi:unnamed protein product [Prunus brigantina]